MSVRQSAATASILTVTTVLAGFLGLGPAIVAETLAAAGGAGQTSIDTGRPVPVC